MRRAGVRGRLWSGLVLGVALLLIAGLVALTEAVAGGSGTALRTSAAGAPHLTSPANATWGHRADSPRPGPAPPADPAPAAPPATAATATTAPATTVPPSPAPAAAAPAAAAAATLAGCPVPPHAPLPPSPPPWHPSVLVPDSALPPVSAPAPWKSDLAAIQGTGMWIWQWTRTAGGDPAAIVAQARAEHLHQLWVRVGDSMDGFYGADELQQLVPAAHAAGLSVIAWGFPYLYDPVGDAGWTAQILDWRSTGAGQPGPGAGQGAGQGVDGYSADIERPSEGVDLTATRAAVYLEQVRKRAGTRPVVATVYPPTDDYWQGGGYPYSAMAPYIDAFAPMIYWECTDPGADATLDVARLATLRPVTVIGQAFDMADVGGRAVAPSAAEIQEFLAAGRKAGAVGASFWVWQDATAEEWAALGAFRW